MKYTTAAFFCKNSFHEFNFLGLHKRPLARAEPLIPVAKAFRAKRVIVHENFKPYTLDFDVALVRAIFCIITVHLAIG